MSFFACQSPSLHLHYAYRLQVTSVVVTPSRSLSRWATLNIARGSDVSSSRLVGVWLINTHIQPPSCHSGDEQSSLQRGVVVHHSDWDYAKQVSMCVAAYRRLRSARMQDISPITWHMLVYLLTYILCGPGTYLCHTCVLVEWGKTKEWKTR